MRRLIVLVLSLKELGLLPGDIQQYLPNGGPQVDGDPNVATALPHHLCIGRVRRQLLRQNVQPFLLRLDLLRGFTGSVQHLQFGRVMTMVVVVVGGGGAIVSARGDRGCRFGFGFGSIRRAAALGTFGSFVFVLFLTPFDIVFLDQFDQLLKRWVLEVELDAVRLLLHRRLHQNVVIFGNLPSLSHFFLNLFECKLLILTARGPAR